MSMLDMMDVNEGMDDQVVEIIRGSQTGQFKNGRYIPTGDGDIKKTTATRQAATPKEIQFATGGQTTESMDKLYFNDGTTLNPSDNDKIRMDGAIWTVVSADNRPSKNYCKAIVVKEDVRKHRKGGKEAQ